MKLVKKDVCVYLFLYLRGKHSEYCAVFATGSCRGQPDGCMTQYVVNRTCAEIARAQNM